jgi:rhodanese-related sulfurtransferase
MKSFIIATVVLLSVNVFAAAPNCESETAFPEISKAELQKSLEAKNVTVFDVNGTASFQKAHVPGAIDYKATKDQFAQNLPADKNAMIVAYCGGPTCGAWKTAAMEACKKGYTNVKHFKAGIKGWMAKN